jgi:hypothetical protein
MPISIDNMSYSSYPRSSRPALQGKLQRNAHGRSGHVAPAPGLGLGLGLELGSSLGLGLGLGRYARAPQLCLDRPLLAQPLLLALLPKLRSVLRDGGHEP